MKKSLLALAVLGAFAGAASAQSSVTIYGLLDLALTKGNGGNSGLLGAVGSESPGGEAMPGGNSTSEAWQLKQSAASRLGFRGNEDMGGGLSAQFQIEHRFSPDTGAAAGTFWAGRSYVQLTSAAAGSVYLGREYTPTFWIAVKTDPFGWDGVGQVALGQYAGFRSLQASSVRTSNTIGYRSPNLGGLTVNAAVGLGEGSNPRDVGFNVEYGAGPLYVGAGFEKLSGGPNVPTPIAFPYLWSPSDGDSLFNLGVAYDFGMVRPILYLARAKVLGGEMSNTDIMFALTAAIGPGKLKAAYNRVKWDKDVLDAKTTHFGIGYDYPLSKRTNVYVDYGQGKIDLPGAENNRAYAFGVKHTF